MAVLSTDNKYRLVSGSIYVSGWSMMMVTWVSWGLGLLMLVLTVGIVVGREHSFPRHVRGWQHD